MSDGSANVPGDTGPEATISSPVPTDDSACVAMGTRSGCQTCCGVVHADAGLRFFAGALMCACATPSLCAPVPSEAGAGEASPQGAGGEAGAGALGQGACTEAMCSGQAVPSNACQQCVTMGIQPASGFGQCTLAAASSCGQDTLCMPVLDCATKCTQTQ